MTHDSTEILTRRFPGWTVTVDRPDGGWSTVVRGQWEINLEELSGNRWEARARRYRHKVEWGGSVIIGEIAVNADPDTAIAEAIAKARAEWELMAVGAPWEVTE